MRSSSLVVLSLLPVWLVCGCNTSARRQLADSRQRIETLQAQTDQLRNEALTLRNRNRDLAQRAVDDARKLRDMEQARAQLERSIAEYQDERRQVTEAFRNLQDEVHRQARLDDPPPQARVDSPPARAVAESEPARPLDPSRFEAFARAQSGTRFDPARAVWTVPAGALFEPGSAKLNARAMLILYAFARLMTDPADPVRPGRVMYAVPAGGEIQQTALETPVTEPASLARDRASAVRGELARRLGVDAGSVAVEAEAGLASGSDDLAIELRAAP